MQHRFKTAEQTYSMYMGFLAKCENFFSTWHIQTAIAALHASGWHFDERGSYFKIHPLLVEISQIITQYWKISNEFEITSVKALKQIIKGMEPDWLGSGAVISETIEENDRWAAIA